jgi:RimJ/RimL family protein N-acetyltransferase
MNADPAVMEHFVAPLTRTESDAMVRELNMAHLAAHGWGLWAAEVVEGPRFIGFVGLSRVEFDAPFTPAVEVGWRLGRDHWGHGYATEGGRAALAFAFDELALPAVVSFTAAGNDRSRRVMERLGLTRDAADDFDHPNVPAGHPIRRHVLYRITRARFDEMRGDAPG